MAKLLASIVKAIAAGVKRAGALARMGVRKAGNFSRSALASIGLGGAGRMRQPDDDQLDPVQDISGLDEALDQLNADIDDENEDEFKAQHRALTEGMEPKDIYDYAKADSPEKRDEVAKLMRKDTVTWVKEKLSDEQRSRIAKTSEDAVKYHMSGVRPIPGVPAFPQNDMRNVAEFRPQDPAAVMNAMGIDVDVAIRASEASAKDPLLKLTSGVGLPTRKAVKGKVADEPELELSSPPAFAHGR